MKKRLILTLCIIMVLFSLTGCGNKSSNNNPSEISGNLLTSDYVKWNGRTYYNEEVKLNYFYYAASGFTVNFYGTKLEAYIYATNVENTTLKPVFAITVDKDLIADGKITVNSSQKKVEQNEKIVSITANNKFTEQIINDKTYKLYKVVLAENLTLGNHSLTLYKQGEAKDNTTAIYSIKTDKHFLKPDMSEKLKIQIMGSSGITGFGDLFYNATNSENVRTTLNSFGMYSFGGLVANMYKADVQFVSVSGYTLTMSGNDLPSIYDIVGLTENGKVNLPYDHNVWHPDIIILNIGGNDTYNSAKIISTTREFTEKMHAVHPNAKIIWTGRGKYGSSIEATISDLNYSYLKYVGPINGVGGTNGNEGYGANDHASVVTQLTNANMIVNTLKTKFNLHPLKTISTEIK